MDQSKLTRLIFCGVCRFALGAEDLYDHRPSMFEDAPKGDLVFAPLKPQSGWGEP
jgi:hypothetical protein